MIFLRSVGSLWKNFRISKCSSKFNCIMQVLSIYFFFLAASFFRSLSLVVSILFCMSSEQIRSFFRLEQFLFAIALCICVLLLTPRLSISFCESITSTPFEYRMFFSDDMFLLVHWLLLQTFKLFFCVSGKDGTTKKTRFTCSCEKSGNLRVWEKGTTCSIPIDTQQWY